MLAYAASISVVLPVPNEDEAGTERDECSRSSLLDMVSRDLLFTLGQQEKEGGKGTGVPIMRRPFQIFGEGTLTRGSAIKRENEGDRKFREKASGNVLDFRVNKFAGPSTDRKVLKVLLRKARAPTPAHVFNRFHHPETVRVSQNVANRAFHVWLL